MTLKILTKKKLHRVSKLKRLGTCD